MHKKLGPRGWQRPKKDCKQLGPEFRQPLIKKKFEIIFKIFGRKKLIYAKIVTKLGDLTVNDENSRIWIQDPEPLLRSMDPRIRIRIHTKMAWFHGSRSTPKCHGSGTLHFSDEIIFLKFQKRA
jgi:hypothetical protein